MLRTMLVSVLALTIAPAWSGAPPTAGAATSDVREVTLPAGTML